MEEKLRIGNPGLYDALRERVEAKAGAGGTSGRRRG